MWMWSGDWCFVYIYKEEVLRGWKVALPSHPNLAPTVLFLVGRKLCHSPECGGTVQGK